MASSDAHLVTLINLLDGRLSVAEGMAVREQLAGDIQLRKHWQTLANAVGSPTPSIDVERTFQLDSETVAAFVDGDLSDGEASTLERTLWENDAALREIIAAIRANHSADTAATGFQRHLENVVEREIGIRLTDNLGETQTLHATRQNVRRVNGTQSVVTGDSPEAHTVAERRNIVKPANRSRSRSRLSPLSIVAATAAIVLLLCVVIFFAVRSNEQPEHRPIAEQPAPELNDDSPSTSDGTNDGVPDHKQPDVPDTPKLVDNPEDKPPANNRPPIPDPRPKPPIAPDSSNRGKVVQVAWADVVGIAARRRISRQRWNGLLAPVDGRSLDEALAVRALPQSWAQGQIASGPNVILAADSEFHLLVRQWEAATPGRTTLDLKILQGRVAITGLSQGDIIRLRDDEHEWTIRAENDETTIGLVQFNALRRQIVVWKGAVQLTDMTLPAGQSVTWNGRIFEPPIADASQQTWQRQPASTLALRQPVIDAINRSNNVLQALTMQNRGGQKKDVRLAANLAFSLDALNAVPMAARSNNETRRLAAVNWLLAAQDGQPETIAVWRKLETSLGTSQAQQTVRGWFQAAQSKTKPTRQQLAELSAGLGAQQPLFMRQAAIHFLRQITGQRLAAYDPNRPTKQSIDAVRQQLRRAASGGRRRGQ